MFHSVTARSTAVVAFPMFQRTFAPGRLAKTVGFPSFNEMRRLRIDDECCRISTFAWASLAALLIG
jgi:hypothetical protein